VAGHERDDEAGPGARPDPLDRLWRHPSELAAFSPRPDTGPSSAPATAPAPTRARSARQWPLLVGAGTVGAIATVAILAAGGILGSGTQRVVTRVVRGRSANESAARVASVVAPTLVAVHVAGTSGAAKGSGFCVRPGYVLTSDELVGGNDIVRVTTAAGTSRTATVVGRDPITDVALLRVDGMAPSAAAVKPSAVRVGTSIVEVATPRSTDRWVSTGVVSSLDRAVTAPSGEMMTGLVGTDANRAPAGSVVVDQTGAVLAMVTAYTDADGTTLAVPMSTLAPVVDDLLTRGRTSHGWLGVSVADSADGAAIDQISADGPAAGSPLRHGDVITKVDSRPVADMAALLTIVRSHRAHDSVQVVVRREHTTAAVTIELGEYSPQPPAVTQTTAIAAVTG
jgi:S1-C subfamily serine protease